MGLDGTSCHLHENTEGPFAQKKERERLSNFKIYRVQKILTEAVNCTDFSRQTSFSLRGTWMFYEINVFLSNTQVTDTVRNFNNLIKESVRYYYFNIFKKNEMSNYGYYFHQVACPNGKAPFTISPLLWRIAIVSILHGTSVTNWKGLSSRS